MIQIPTADLKAGKDKVVAVAVIAENAPLRLVSGKRTLTLKPKDLEIYLGVRAKRGSGLPRGFQRVDKMMSVD